MQQLNERRSSLAAKIAASRRSRYQFQIIVFGNIVALVWGLFFLRSYFFGSPKQVPVDDQHLLPHHTIYHAESPEKSHDLNLSHLNRLTRTSVIDYTRRVIRTVHVQGNRSDLTRINQRLLGPWMKVQMPTMSEIAVPVVPPLILEVQLSPNVDTSMFSFGMATTVPRMEDAISGISHWLSYSSAQLHILAPAHDNASALEKKMREGYMNATFHAEEAPFAPRYVSLIEKLYQERSANTRWLVLVDDDTFFPSLASLATHFTRSYNSTKPMIVGALSDDLRVIELYGLSASGGGGIFVSIPLAEELLQQPVWGKCLALPNNEGDELLNSCLNKFSQIRPTFDPLLHQMDIYNGEGFSPEAGYLESGRKLLSIHHWKTWYEFDVSKGAAVAAVSGDEAIFQRWLFDDDTVLSNGYSVVQYPRTGTYGGITEKELGEVEYTWNEGDPEELWRYVHMMGPLRPRKSSEKKRSARLVDAVEVAAPEGRAIRQTYVEKSQINTAFRPRERVVELIWLF